MLPRASSSFVFGDDADDYERAPYDDEYDDDDELGKAYYNDEDAGERFTPMFWALLCCFIACPGVDLRVGLEGLSVGASLSESVWSRLCSFARKKLGHLR